MHLKKCIISNILHRTAVVFAGGLPFLPNLAQLPPPWPFSAPSNLAFPRKSFHLVERERPLMRLAGKRTSLVIEV